MSDAVLRGPAAASTSFWYLLLPAVLAYRPPVFGGVSLNLQYLVIPVAALLGARFGLTGVIAVAIGGLAFVISVTGMIWGAIGGHPSLYLIALAVSAIAASSSQPPIAWPQWPRTSRSVAAVTAAVPLLLVLHLFVGYQQPSGPGGVRLAFGFSPSVLGYFVIFLLAARGAKLGHLLAGLGLVAFVSWLLVYLRLFPADSSNLMLDMLPLQPVAVMTALAYFSAGALFPAAHGRPVAWGWWRWPYTSALILLLIWLGPGDLNISLEWTRKIRVNFAQSAALLPVVAFVIGALGGRRGVWVVTALTAVLVIAGWQVGLATYHYLATLQLEGPFLAYAFGRLGAHVAGSWSERTSRIPRTVTAWTLAVATTIAIVGEDPGALRVTLGIVFALLFCAAYFFGRRLMRASAGTEREVTPQGWLTFLIVVCSVLLVALHLPEVAEEVRKTVAGIASPFVLLYSLLRETLEAGHAPASRPADGLALFNAAMGAFLLLAGFQACRKAWKDARKVWRDIRVLYRYGKLMLSHGKRGDESKLLP